MKFGSGYSGGVEPCSGYVKFIIRMNHLVSLHRIKMFYVERIG